MAANIKMAAFWGIALCSLVETGRPLRGVYSLQHQGDDRPDDGGKKHIRKRQSVSMRLHRISQ
jgi:hypothetical protein